MSNIKQIAAYTYTDIEKNNHPWKAQLLGAY